EIVVDEGGTAALGATIARVTGSGPGRPPQPAAVPTATTAPPPPPAPVAAKNGAGTGRSRATPVARRLATELGVELAGVEGTGPGGRIVGADGRDAASAGGNDVELTPTQRTIAQRMTESRSQIPEFTLEAEIEMEAIAELREELRGLGREPLPSFNDLVVKAVAVSLRKHPAVNASWANGRIRRNEHLNVRIAVATDD